MLFADRLNWNNHTYNMEGIYATFPISEASRGFDPQTFHLDLAIKKEAHLDKFGWFREKTIKTPPLEMETES